VTISIGVGLFLLAQGLSVVFVPQLLYLHLLQTPIYLSVLVGLREPVKLVGDRLSISVEMDPRAMAET